MTGMTLETAASVAAFCPIWLRGPHASLAVRVMRLRGGRVEVCSAAYGPPHWPSSGLLVDPADLSWVLWPDLAGRVERPVLDGVCGWHPNRGLPLDLCPEPDDAHTGHPLIRGVFA